GPDAVQGGHRRHQGHRQRRPDARRDRSRPSDYRPWSAHQPAQSRADLTAPPGEIAMFPSLSDEQRRFVQTIRDLAQREFRPRVNRYMDGSFPWENMRALADLGALGMAVPEGYGGLGLPVFDTALVLEEIAKVCYVTAMAVLGEVGVQTRIIATYAPEPVKQPILPAGRRGDWHAGGRTDR